MQKGTEKLILQKEIKYGLYPGREVVLSDASTISETRLGLYLIENALYTLQVSMDANNGSIRAAEKFLNSFKLLAYADGGL
jgi:hypothetical protein